MREQGGRGTERGGGREGGVALGEFESRAFPRVFACGAARSPTCATVATMAEALAPDTYSVTISNIYVTSSSSSLFSMQLVLNSRDAGVLGCSIARLAAPRPARERSSRPRRALSPQPCAPGRLCSPPCIVIVSLAYSFALSRSPASLSLSLARARTHVSSALSLSLSLSLSPAFSHYVSPLSRSFSPAPSSPPTPRRWPVCRQRGPATVFIPRLRQTSPTPSTAPMRLRIDRCAQSPRGSRFVSRCPRRRTRRSSLANQRPPARTHGAPGWGTAEK